MTTHRLPNKWRAWVVIAAVAGVLALAGPREAPASTLPVGWEERPLLSMPTAYAEAEVEVAADNATPAHVVAVWMKGEPSDYSRLWTNFSADGGSTWASAAPVESTSTGTADPSLAMDLAGNTWLGGVRKDSTGRDWSNTAAILWNAQSGGSSFSPNVDVQSNNQFNDRDWLTTDSSNTIHYVYSPRVGYPTNVTDRPIYYTNSTDGVTWSTPVLVNGTRPGLTENGGDAARIGVTTGGRIVVGENATTAGNGNSTFTGDGYAYVSDDGAQSFTPYRFNTDTTKLAIAQTQPKATYGSIEAAGDTVYAIWIGVNKSSWSVYESMLTKDATSFSTPTAVTTSETDTLTLPALAVDTNSNIHVTWIGQMGCASTSGSPWCLLYSTSTSGNTWSDPVQISSFTWAIPGWTGDFDQMVTNDHDLFVAWSANPGGSSNQVYVSIKRGIP